MSIQDLVIVGNIKSIIKNSGCKNYAIAEKCGYTDRQFSNILTGRKKITSEDVKKLCDGLEITPNDLYGYIEST